MDIRRMRSGARVLGTFIDALTWVAALDRITYWARARESRYVCICNVHSVVTTTQDPDFHTVLNEADMATADGAPVAWMLRRLGFPFQERLNGPDLMWRYCQVSEQTGLSVYLYGSTERVLTCLYTCLREHFPRLKIAGMASPPFRELTPDEDDAITQAIETSGAAVVFVSLGCPKQEKWMAAHRRRINAVMIGVGAAFDYHSGMTSRAPNWMQRLGLEWFHRLLSEPRRLWKRYLVTNTLFLLGAARQLLAQLPRY